MVLLGGVYTFFGPIVGALLLRTMDADITQNYPEIWQLFLGGVLVLIPFTVWEAIWWLPSTLSWSSVGLVLAAALAPGAAAYGAYSFMQRVLGAARVAMVLYLGPLYSALIGWAVLGETLGPTQMAGMLVVLMGVALVTLPSRLA